MRSRITLLPLLLLGTALIVMGATDAPIVDSPHGKLQEECSLCHSVAGWKPISLSPEFDHARFGTALEGAHSDLYCGFCHTTLEFTGLDDGCVNCHVDAHDGELGIDCEQCHGYTSFTAIDDQIRMHRTSSFPLSGAHTSVSCESCHPPTPPGVNEFLLTSSECVECHEPEFESVLEPDHTGLGFSADCERCHRITNWDDARFDHSGVRGVPCVDCHRDEYDATENPDHSVIGFDTNCEDCHNTIRWGDGKFDHVEYFPIYSGAHREPWDDCSDCHMAIPDFEVFDCLGCHPHDNELETGRKHREVDGEYQYDSDFCYGCHENGRS